MKKTKIVFIMLICMIFGLTILSNAVEITGTEENEETLEITDEQVSEEVGDESELEGETYAILNKHEIKMYEGGTYKLEVDTDYLGEKRWESSNEEIATIEDGIITAIKPGNVVITVICGEFTDTCQVEVNEVSLKLNSDESISIYKNKSYQLDVDFPLGDDLIKYSSQNKSIAKVTTYGKIIGIAPGKTTITISAKNCEDIKITVNVVDKELSAPVLKISRNSTSFNITWNKITGASKYIVYRKVGTGSWIKVTTTTSTKYTDKNLTYGKKYYYKVKATGTSYGLERTSGYSSYVYGSTTTIYKPASVTVQSIGYNKIKISWSKVVPAKGYEIYRATSKNGKYKKIATITSASTITYTDSKLTTGKTYYYKIRAIYGTTKSAYTTVKYATPTLKAPEIKNYAYVTSNSIKLKWEPVTGATGYAIYRRTTTSKSWEKIATVKGANTVTYTNKTTGKYYYSVRAYRTVDGKKVYGNRSDSIRACALKKTSITAVQDGEKISQVVSWSTVKNATSYQVYRKIGKNGTWERVKSTTALVYKTNVNHGVKIYWKVRPVYQYNGDISYGEYSAVTTCMASYKPNYSVFMSDDCDPSTYSIGMIFTNNGVDTVRIYSDEALYLDAAYPGFNRALYLIETDTGYFYPVDYIDILPGESKIVMFSVYDYDDTWYDATGRLYYKFKYDGVTYIGCSSADYGNTYWEN